MQPLFYQCVYFGTLATVILANLPALGTTSSRRLCGRNVSIFGGGGSSILLPADWRFVQGKYSPVMHKYRRSGRDASIMCFSVGNSCSFEFGRLVQVQRIERILRPISICRASQVQVHNVNWHAAAVDPGLARREVRYVPDLIFCRVLSEEEDKVLEKSQAELTIDPIFQIQKWFCILEEVTARNTNSSMELSVDRRCERRGCLVETVTATTESPWRRIKGWPFVHIPSSAQPRILSSLLFSSSLLSSPSNFTFFRGLGQLPVTAMARAGHKEVPTSGGIQHPRALCCIPRAPLRPFDPPLIQPLHTIRDLASACAGVAYNS